MQTEPLYKDLIYKVNNPFPIHTEKEKKIIAQTN